MYNVIISKNAATLDHAWNQQILWCVSKHILSIFHYFSFQLKPYVSYKAKEIKQKALSSEDIFESVYSPDLTDAVLNKKHEIVDGKIVLPDGTSFNYVKK